MYPISGKLIQYVSVTARLCEFSHKRAVVMLEEPQDYELCLGMDVEIFAAADNGKALFTETYAKIIEKKDSSLTLCFTHVNRSFQSFAGQLWDHIERD